MLCSEIKLYGVHGERETGLLCPHETEVSELSFCFSRDILASQSGRALCFDGGDILVGKAMSSEDLFAMADEVDKRVRYVNRGERFTFLMNSFVKQEPKKKTSKRTGKQYDAVDVEVVVRMPDGHTEKRLLNDYDERDLVRAWAEDAKVNGGKPKAEFVWQKPFQQGAGY